jgi:predicted Zn-dependent protease
MGLCAWMIHAPWQPAAAQATQPETIEAAEAAWRQNPTDPSAAVLYARALTRAGQPDRAAEVLQPLLTNPRPAIRNRIRLELANALIAAERFDEAAKQIDAVAAEEPTAAQIERVAKLRQDLEQERVDAARRAVRQQIADIKQQNEAGGPDAIYDALQTLSNGPAGGDAELLALIRIEQANQRMRQDRLDDAARILATPPVSDLTSQAKPRTDLLAKIESRRAELAEEQRRKAMDERLAAADALVQAGDLEAAETAYEAMLAEQPPLAPEDQHRVRMALANVLQKQGHYGDARDVLNEIGDVPMNATQRNRLSAIQGRIDERLTPNQFSGWLQFGAAYDDDAPAVYSANRTESDEDEVVLLPEQGLDDTQEAVSGRIEYRRLLSGDLDYWRVAAQGLKTWQNDLSEFDRAQLRVSTGPTLVFPEIGVTTSLAGGYQRLWKGDTFNNNEYSADFDIGWDTTDSLELGAFYSHVWHDDVRIGRDGDRNDFGLTADYRLTNFDRITLRARALRIDEEVPDNESWSHSYDAYYSHLFPINDRLDLFAEGNVGVDFVRYDDPSTSSLHLGEMRRDTILTWGLGGGAVLDDVWTGRLGYFHYDLDSNFDEKSKDDNRVFLTLRRSF